MKRALACLVAALPWAHPPAALAQSGGECDDGSSLLFSCDFPEYNAQIQLCRDQSSGKITYSYHADGQTELSFVDGGLSGAQNHIRGIRDYAYFTSLNHGGTIYAVFVEQPLLLDDPEPGTTGSSNPAVLQVYSDLASLEQAPDAPITRRVCEPRSIWLDREWFGPG